MDRSSLLAIFLLGLTTTVAAQEPKVMAPHKPIPPRVPKSQEQRVPQELRSLVGGPWMIDANLKSSLYLRNEVETEQTTVTPILYLSNGKKLTLPDVPLAGC
jgi:hypothetical protein